MLPEGCEWYNDEPRSFDGCSYCLTASAVGDHSPSCDCGCHKPERRLFRCSLCEREFDEMPPDGLHTVHGRYPVSGGYIDADGECGPVYEVE